MSWSAVLSQRNAELIELLDRAGGLDAVSVAERLSINDRAARFVLGRLSRDGLAESVRPFPSLRGLWIPTPLGLREAVGRDNISPPSISTSSYTHQRAAGRVGALLDGAGLSWRSERIVRREQRDAAREGDAAAARRYSLRLPGRKTSHLPDLLVWPDGSDHAIAVEIELSSKTDRRLADILSGYALDLDIAGVVYLCGGPHPDRIQSALTRANRTARAALITAPLDAVDAAWITERFAGSPPAIAAELDATRQESPAPQLSL